MSDYFNLDRTLTMVNQLYLTTIFIGEKNYFMKRENYCKSIFQIKIEINLVSNTCQCAKTNDVTSFDSSSSSSFSVYPLWMLAITFVQITFTAELNRVPEVIPVHCLRLLSHEVLLRPGPFLLSILSCRISWKRRYFSLLIICPKSSRFLV